MKASIDSKKSLEGATNLLFGAVIVGTGAFINELGDRFFAPQNTMLVNTPSVVSQPWIPGGVFGDALRAGLVLNTKCMSLADLPPRPSEMAETVTEVRLPRFHDALGDMGTGSSRRIIKNH